eukprot:scpid93559/ scgid21993/ 
MIYTFSSLLVMPINVLSKQSAAALLSGLQALLSTQQLKVIYIADHSLTLVNEGFQGFDIRVQLMQTAYCPRHSPLESHSHSEKQFGDQDKKTEYQRVPEVTVK